jgi:hypothetical protein
LGTGAGLWLIALPLILDAQPTIAVPVIALGAMIALCSAWCALGYRRLGSAITHFLGGITFMLGASVALMPLILNYVHPLWSMTSLIVFISGTLAALIAAYATITAPETYES